MVSGRYTVMYVPTAQDTRALAAQPVQSTASWLPARSAPSCGVGTGIRPAVIYRHVRAQPGGDQPVIRPGDLHIANDDAAAPAYDAELWAVSSPSRAGATKFSFNSMVTACSPSFNNDRQARKNA